MNDENFPWAIRTFEWLDSHSDARYDLSKSAFPFPNYLKLNLLNFTEYLNSGIDGEEELVNKLSKRYSVDPDNVIPTVGGTEAIYIAIMSLKSRRVLVHSPEYEPFFRMAQLAGKEIFTRGIIAGALPANFDGAVAFTTPNNPTGVKVDPAQYSDFREIFIDETFAHYTLSDKLPPNDFNVTFAGTMSKLFGASETRVGWLISSSANIERYKKFSDLTTNGTSAYSMYVSSLILGQESRIAEMNRSMIRENAKLVSEFLEESNLSAKLSTETAFCFPEYSMKIDSVSLCTRIFEDSGVLLVPGAYFGEEGRFRLCFTSDKPSLEQALTALSGSLSKLRHIY